MNIKDILMYILLMVLIAVTLFNFYAMITSKKRRARSAASYQQEMGTIENNLLKLMKERALNFTTVKRLMNDKGEGIIVVTDPDKRKAAIGMRGDIELFSFEDLESAGKEYLRGEKGKLLGSRVYAVISGTKYEYTIGSRPFRPKGPLGKVVYDTTEEFHAELERIIAEGKKQAPSDNA